jgi:putative peptidoglycan lipid II flippase
MTLISRIAGLARDSSFAWLIGAGLTAAPDAFYVAFRIPNFLRRVFGEGALSQAFIPVFAEYRARSQDDAKQFVDHVAGVLSVALFVVTLVGVIAAPLLILVLAPGFAADAHKYELTVTMLRIVFPFIFFISLVALAAGILNTYGRFGAAAFTPVLMNLCLIAAAVWVAPRLDEPVIGLAWGVFAAGVVQLLFQIPFLRRIGMLPRPRFSFRDEGVRRVMRLMVPGIFGVSVAQINLVVNMVLASFLVTGSVSWLYFADRIMEFPVGVFGVALSTVILPQLAHTHVNATREDFSHLLDMGLRWALIISVPASVALMLLAGPASATLFHFGRFGDDDVRMTASALVVFSAGLIPFILIRILAPGFYARQDTKTPMRVGIYALVVNIIMCLLLIFPLKHVGLAAATSIAAFVNAGWLYRLLRQQGIYLPAPGWGTFFARIAFATTAMGALLYWGSGELEWWLAADWWERILRLLVWCVVGAAVYGAALLATGMRPGHLKLKRQVS